jgi:pimeloyl-ACP methyl ester carboxylesterase
VIGDLIFWIAERSGREGCEMPKVRVNGIELFMRRGRGEALVLIMGFGGIIRLGRFRCRRLRRGIGVIRFDNRGAGQSGVPDAPYSTRGWQRMRWG